MIITIHFEDKGQDFLLWVVDTDTWEILDSKPFQASHWCNYFVYDPEKLNVGDRVHIIKSSDILKIDSDELEMLTIKYKVDKIEKEASL